MKLSARFAESWDKRLRLTEKELLCAIAAGPSAWALVSWRDLPEEPRRRLFIAMRAVVELGRECEHALAYTRTRSNSNNRP